MEGGRGCVFIASGVFDSRHRPAKLLSKPLKYSVIFKSLKRNERTSPSLLALTVSLDWEEFKLLKREN